ncbi:MAG TPA: hypothetical protein VIL37_17485 [Natronosporangium sp.]
MRQRWAWTNRHAVPLFVAALVAFVLAGGSLLTVLVLDNRADGDRPSTESCHTGIWQVTSYTEQDELGTARMIEGEPVLRFNEDGTGLADFGNGARVEVETLLIGTVVGTVAGQISYRYESSEQTLEFVEQQSNARITAEAEYAGLLPPGDFTLPEGPLDYSCAGDEMTFSDGEQNFQLRRTG